MAKLITVKKGVALTDDLARQVEDFRFHHRYKSETDAMRVLIEAGLKAFEARDSAHTAP